MADKCNCTVGYNEELILLDDLDRFSAYQIQSTNLIKYYYGENIPYIKDNKEYWRNNRHQFFTYCPDCGVKIQWNALLNMKSDYSRGGYIKKVEERLEGEK